jgi:hypothetical protein
VTRSQLSVRLLQEVRDSPYAAEAGAVLAAADGDIDPDFLGFLEPYEALSRIIPRGRTILDLGCGYAFQSWYFRHHRKYIGVDVRPLFFRAPNSQLAFETRTINPSG